MPCTTWLTRLSHLTAQCKHQSVTVSSADWTSALAACLPQEGVLRALAILCEHHADARGKFVQRASIRQLAKELDSPDLEVLAVLL